MPEARAESVSLPLPALLPVDEVQRRLQAIFPAAFPDRSILVGRMAAHVVFVFLYGGFIQNSGRLLRPSLVYFFTAEQADRIANTDRLVWLASAFKPGYRPSGKRWYADNSRESIRDDLMRGRLLAMGIIGRKEGVATTSSAPVYFLRAAFAALFDPALNGQSMLTAFTAWRTTHLTSSTLKRSESPAAIRAIGRFGRTGVRCQQRTARSHPRRPG